jgi:Golgi apyrase
MGGASAQIAFEPTEIMAKKHSDDVKNVVLRMTNGKTKIKSVFVTSFLGFGANQARDRYINLYAYGKTDFADPCLNSGLEFPSGTTAISGSGDFQQCMTKINPLMNLEKKCSEDPCLFDGIHAPIEDFRNHKFLGVSELWYTTSQVYGLGGLYNYEKLQAATEKLCSTPWSEISTGFQDKKYTNVDSLSRMKLKCFKSAYLLNILHEGFRLPKSQNPAILETVDDLDGYSVSWTMGAALLLASSQIPHSSIPKLTYQWTSILIIILLILFGGFYYFVSKTRGTVYDLTRFHDIEKKF